MKNMTSKNDILKKKNSKATIQENLLCLWKIFYLFYNYKIAYLYIVPTLKTIHKEENW